MTNSDIKTLRDQNARLVADNKKKDDMISRLATETEDLRRRVFYYENSHSLPSQNSIRTMQNKAHRRTSHSKVLANFQKKPGQKKGHIGASYRRRSDAIVQHIPDKCGSCGHHLSSSQDAGIAYTKQVIDMPEIPKYITTAHIVQ